MVDGVNRNLGGDKPRHYIGSPEEPVKTDWALGYLFNKSRLNLRQAQVSKPLPQSIVAS